MKFYFYDHVKNNEVSSTIVKFLSINLEYLIDEFKNDAVEKEEEIKRLKKRKKLDEDEFYCADDDRDRRIIEKKETGFYKDAIIEAETIKQAFEKRKIITHHYCGYENEKEIKFLGNQVGFWLYGLNKFEKEGCICVSEKMIGSLKMPHIKKIIKQLEEVRNG